MSHWGKTKAAFKIGPVQQSLHVCLRFDFGPFASSTLCVFSLATCTSAWVEKGPVKVVSIVLFGKNEAGTGDSEVGNHRSNHHWQVPFKKKCDWTYDTPPLNKHKLLSGNKMFGVSLRNTSSILFQPSYVRLTFVALSYIFVEIKTCWPEQFEGGEHSVSISEYFFLRHPMSLLCFLHFFYSILQFHNVSDDDDPTRLDLNVISRHYGKILLSNRSKKWWKFHQCGIWLWLFLHLGFATVWFWCDILLTKVVLGFRLDTHACTAPTTISNAASPSCVEGTDACLEYKCVCMWWGFYHSCNILSHRSADFQPIFCELCRLQPFLNGGAIWDENSYIHYRLQVPRIIQDHWRLLWATTCSDRAAWSIEIQESSDLG